ncbi:NADPH:quinone oxidoreductase family protein [Nocardioides yefusunii]|uniref:NADPH:quinone oxidoreductase family protein n=1 Tax=Nocardioides yefusunii TaxID=2500546 RepID=A0ABW1R1J9_9ACTN|nr:NADPH:quinone oxidoreductase family protein [Nocardioides yefusunii]
MRAAQVVTLTGPADVVVQEAPDLTPGVGEVLVEVHAAGLAFPDVLLSRGQYQMKPEPPFTLGADVAGVVAALGRGVTGLEVGQRVAGVIPHGGAAEYAVLPADWVFPLPGILTFTEGAALGMNYLTADFVLHRRAQVRPGETVLVHGAAGGVGTATIQVAKAMGAEVIAVVSTQEKSVVARAAGADHILFTDGFLNGVKSLTEGRGVDVVVDVVGGEVFTDSLRALAQYGRLVVVGFAAGQGIPEVKVNRLLLNNIDVRGAGWGAAVMTTPGAMQEQWARIEPMIDSGVVRPPISAVHQLDDVAHGLLEIDERRAAGKVVLAVR